MHENEAAKGNETCDPAGFGRNTFRFWEKKDLDADANAVQLFCGSDFKVAERYGMRLMRQHTEAEGFPDCDFWYLMENDAEM